MSCCRGSGSLFGSLVDREVLFDTLRNVAATLSKVQQFGRQVFLMRDGCEPAKCIRLLPQIRHALLHGRDASQPRSCLRGITRFYRGCAEGDGYIFATRLRPAYGRNSAPRRR